MSRSACFSVARLALAVSLLAATALVQQAEAVEGVEIVITANGHNRDVTGCRAPCAVHFTAARSSIHPSANLYLDVDYAWDFGEGSNPRRWGEEVSRETAYIGECNGCSSVAVMDIRRNDPRAKHTEASLAVVDGALAHQRRFSRNEYRGASTTSHLYEIPGRYTVTVTATDASFVEYRASRVVDVVAAAASVHCFSADAETAWAGCPAGAQRHASMRDLAMIQSRCAYNCKYLLQRGDRFTTPAAHVSWDGDDLVAAFGDGPAPVIAHADPMATGTPFAIAGPFAAMDLVIDYGSGPYNRNATAFMCRNKSGENAFTLVRVRVLGGAYGVSCGAAAPTSIFNDLAAVYDTSFIGLGGTRGDQYNIWGFPNPNGQVSGGFQHMGIYHGAVATAQQDPMRGAPGNYLVAQFSVMDFLAAPKNSGWRIVQNSVRPTRGIVIGYCAFTRNRSFIIGGQDPTEHVPAIHDVVIEGNYFANSTGEPPRPSGRGVAIRNNFGAGKTAFVARQDARFQIGDYRIYGNTWVARDNGRTLLFDVAERQSVGYPALTEKDVCAANVVYGPAGAKLDCSAKTAVESHNVIKAGGPCPISNCAARKPDDFMLKPGSPAVGAVPSNGADGVLLLRDAFNQTRPRGAVDAGAHRSAR